MTLTAALSLTYNQLNAVAQSPDYWTILKTAFGSNYDQTLAATLQQQWQAGDFSALPPIQILSGDTLGNAMGAYAASNNTIYLSEALLASSAEQIEAASVIETLTPNMKISRALVVIDAGVDDREFLVKGVLPDADVMVLDRHCNAIAQIGEVLQACDFGALQIVAHGSEGELWLGNASLNLSNLLNYATALQSWRVDEISLYACEVASGATGRDFVRQLAVVTGARVAAATTKVGNRASGGSWDLAVQTGAIATPLMIENDVLASYTGVLATITVQNVNAPSTGNYYPFGGGFGNDWLPYMGFIYKNIPAFNAALGDTIAFDVNIQNNTAIQLDIALAATTTNGGFTPAGTFTKVASNTQTPSDPNGNNVIGDYELLFTFENSFSFTGGGLIIQFSNPSSLYSSDTTPTFNIVGSVASDASNFFVGRYYNDADGIPNSINNDSFIGNFRLTTSLDAPTDLTLSANSITENVNTTGGIEIGGITITDPNAVGNNNVLSVEGIDAANFEIRNGTKLFFIGTSPDFETKSVYSINLKTTDGSLTYSKAFAIAVTDVDEFDVTPPIDSNVATNTIAENAANGTVVAITANATDADGSNNTVTYRTRLVSNLPLIV